MKNTGVVLVRKKCRISAMPRRGRCPNAVDPPKVRSLMALIVDHGYSGGNRGSTLRSTPCRDVPAGVGRIRGAAARPLLPGRASGQVVVVLRDMPIAHRPTPKTTTSTPMMTLLKIVPAVVVMS